MRSAQEILDRAYDVHGMTTMEGLSDGQRAAIDAIEASALVAIEQAQREAIEEAAGIALAFKSPRIASEIRSLTPSAPTPSSDE